MVLRCGFLGPDRWVNQQDILCEYSQYILYKKKRVIVGKVVVNILNKATGKN
jgi:hypothetical protein